MLQYCWVVGGSFLAVQPAYDLRRDAFRQIALLWSLPAHASLSRRLNCLSAVARPLGTEPCSLGPLGIVGKARRSDHAQDVARDNCARVTHRATQCPCQHHLQLDGGLPQVSGGPIPLCTHATLHVVTTDDYIPGEVFTPNFGCTLTTCTPVSRPVLLEFLYSDGVVTIDEAPIWLSDSGFYFCRTSASAPHCPAKVVF